jgi:DNA topoisomerase-2
MYQTRKEYIISSLEKELILLNNKSRYIMEILNDTIDLRKKKKDDILNLLSSKGYSMINDDTEFKYLIKMPMDSVTEENVHKLNTDYSNKEIELTTIKNTTIHKMWESELDKLLQEYLQYKEERERMMSDSDNKNTKKKIVSSGVKKYVKKAITIID